jgi:hypothetical protein
MALSAAEWLAGSGRGRSKRRLRRFLVALGLAAILAGAAVKVMDDRDIPRNSDAPLSTVNTSWQFETARSQQAPLRESMRDARSFHAEQDGTVGATLEDFESAFHATSEEELDLFAAARLPDLVRRDPHKVARFVELEPSSKQREVLVRHVSRLWGESDAEGAFAWAEDLPDSQERDLAGRAICLSLAQTNPSDAVNRCAWIVADAAGEADFQGVFQAWVQSDPVSASEWLDAQPASARVDKLRQRQVHVLAQTKPLTALRLTQDGFTSPSVRDEAVLAVLHQWALQDPDAARDWAANYAPVELRPRAISEIEGLESYSVGR